MQVKYFQNSKCFIVGMVFFVVLIVLCFILIAVVMYLQGGARAFSIGTPLLLCYARGTPTRPENGVAILIKMKRKYCTVCPQRYNQVLNKDTQFSLRGGPKITLSLLGSR